MSLIVRSTRAVELSRRRLDRAVQMYHTLYGTLLGGVLLIPLNPYVYPLILRELVQLETLVLAARVRMARAQRRVLLHTEVQRRLMTRYLRGHGRFARLSVELVERIVGLTIEGPPAVS